MVEPSIVISSTCNAFVFIELDAIFVMVAESNVTFVPVITFAVKTEFARLPIVAESAVAVVLAISPVTETPVVVVSNLLTLSSYNSTELLSPMTM